MARSTHRPQSSPKTPSSSASHSSASRTLVSDHPSYTTCSHSAPPYKRTKGRWERVRRGDGAQGVFTGDVEVRAVEVGSEAVVVDKFIFFFEDGRSRGGDAECCVGTGCAVHSEEGDVHLGRSAVGVVACTGFVLCIRYFHFNPLAPRRIPRTSSIHTHPLTIGSPHRTFHFGNLSFLRSIQTPPRVHHLVVPFELRRELLQLFGQVLQMVSGAGTLDGEHEGSEFFRVEEDFFRAGFFPLVRFGSFVCFGWSGVGVGERECGGGGCGSGLAGILVAMG